MLSTRFSDAERFRQGEYAVTSDGSNGIDWPTVAGALPFDKLA